MMLSEIIMQQTLGRNSVEFQWLINTNVISMPRPAPLERSAERGDIPSDIFIRDSNSRYES